MRRLAFILPSLSETAAQNEDVVQLVVFAAARLEQHLANRTGSGIAVTILSVQHDTKGWSHLAGLFSKAALKYVTVELLEEPSVPNLAIAGHKPAYNLFEYLKQCEFDEIHCLDRQGFAYYPTQAKLLGLYFLHTVFAVHVVGGTIFRNEVADNLLKDLGTLMDDMLERGSLERADVIFVHDRKAWQWYADKITLSAQVSVLDMAWPQPAVLTPAVEQADFDAPRAISFYGPLGPDGGLPLFCDSVERALPKLTRPVEIFFVGASQAVGGMDAVSYIRLRTAKWSVPVVIKRDLSIADELAFLLDLNSIVFCSTVRRESLRARLIAGSRLPLLHINGTLRNHQSLAYPGYPAVPGRVAQALVEMVAHANVSLPATSEGLVSFWRAERPELPELTSFPPSAPLHYLGDDQPRVSVCVIHFSRPQKLRTALESLKQQTYRNFEVIVVDDGSPDPAVQKELAIIKQEIEPLGWRLFACENRYLGAARNFGASQATGDYLIFMDDDNAAKPNEISTFVAVAQRTGAGIVTTFYDAFETERDLTDTLPSLRFTPFGSDPTLGILTNCFGDANALYKREVFEQLGGFTEDYGITHEDWELFCRAALEGVKLVCVPEPLFWYRVDQGGMFRGEYTQLHKNANLRRHIRPFLEKLPYDQAKLVQLVQGLSTELPLVTVGEQTREAAPRTLHNWQTSLPYGRVAVITRTKDRPLLLHRAIRSVLSQTFKDWLLVIVNDGGNPETVDLVVDEMADEIAGRVLVLHHPISLGMQTAANAGLSSCDSDFIIIHDDDDSWEPTFLARTVSLLDERGWDPRSGGVVTWARVIVEEIGADDAIKTHNSFIFDAKLYNISLIDLAIENRFPPISFLFRRAALEVVGPFREQHGVLGDWEFHLRLLRQFDIAVLPEPLANYHHRTNTTTGVYGNSVHVQTDIHRLKRVELINGAVRGQLGDESALPLPQLMALGELHHSLIAEQQHEFQRLHDYLWMIENQVKYISSRIDHARPSDHGHRPDEQPAVARRQRNLLLNGDLRQWPGSWKTHKGGGGKYAYAQICPGFIICYDGTRLSYQIERRKWTDDGQQLPFGKTLLHIENDGQTRGGSWFALELDLPSVALVAGQQICISGIARINGYQEWIDIDGRYHLGDGRELAWPIQRVYLPREFGRWNCTIVCPSVQASELQRGHKARIILKLPYEQPFKLDLTDIQVELGAVPTEFEYNDTISLRQRLAAFWHRTKRWLKQARVTNVASDDAFGSEVSV